MISRIRVLSSQSDQASGSACLPAYPPLWRSQIMPAWITTTLLALLLTLLSYKLLKRGASTYRQESRNFQAAAAAAENVRWLSFLLPCGMWNT